MPAGEPDAQPRFGDAWLDLRLANRHGLVTGATGTGKTVTLQVLAEGFSRAGVPVFAPDIKGDLSGIAARGEARDFLVARAAAIGIAYAPETFPVEFWDLFGTAGHPIRATVSEMGPLLIARLLGLNDTQEGVLNIAFRVADEEGMLLLDLKDLRALMTFVGDNAASLGRVYGNVAPATVGAIQRQLLVLENQGADAFFGEPALKIADLMRVDAAGRGVVNLLAADRLMGAPRLYACFLLWLLSELFEELPEVGDLDKPKLVFFFDEAHLLFDAAPKVLLEKVEQVVRLIRSKGVGVYFVTQNPLDVPDKVLSQLGNRVQHALRAFTPRDQKAVKAAAETFRPNPEIDTAAAITELGKGEALVSVLEGNGTPTMVARTLIAPPRARVGPIAPELRAAAIARSPLRAAYGTLVDRHSAFEMLRDRAAPQRDGRVADGAAAGRPAPGSEPRRGGTSVPKAGGRSSGPATPAPPDSRPPARPSTRMSTSEAAVRQMARSAASEVGRQLGRAILRGLLGGLRR
nr:helicase HerA-like domain-containing protein [Aquabacter spiritensis]